jgi:predicted dehydrogenase
MIAAIDGKEKLVVDGPEGCRSVEIVLAIYKSAETGQVVKLPLDKDPELKARNKD